MKLFNLRLLLFLFLWLLAPARAESATVQERYLDEPVFGGRVFLLEAGRDNSQTLLLVHGLGDQASATWAGLIDWLAADYHVLAVDLPGFGRSDKGNKLYSPGAYADFLHWLTGRLAAEKPLVVVGHSLGGAIVLRFAADYPKQVRRLILVDVAGILSRNIVTRELLDPNLRQRLPGVLSRPSGWVDDWVGKFVTDLPNLPVDMDLVLTNSTLRGRMLSGDPSRIAALALVQEDYSRTLRQIEAPAFIIWGEKDQVTPLRTGQLLETILPQASLRVIPDAGHVPMRDQPDLFQAAFARALTDSPALKAAPSGPAGRVGVCRDQQNLIFSGLYDRLEITGCDGVRLIDVHAGQVTISGSRVNIEQGEFRGEGATMRVTDSLVVASGLRVIGDPALTVVDSRLDLAGVDLIGRQNALDSDQLSVIVFSVGLLEDDNGQKYIHGRFQPPPPPPVAGPSVDNAAR